MPLEDGRDTLELIDTQSAEVKALKGIVASKDIQIDKLILSVNDLNKNRLRERAEWQDQFKAINNKYIKTDIALKRERHKRWGIGAFCGIVYTGEPVIGVGVVYRLW